MEKEKTLAEQKAIIVHYLKSRTKWDKIEQKASKYFDKLLSLTNLEIRSLNEDEIRRVNDDREIFVNIIRHHFVIYKTKLLVGKLNLFPKGKKMRLLPPVNYQTKMGMLILLSLQKRPE